ncbi:hypothetical protein [Actinomyces gaoshouyii]|uniref:hypothetical protein n=1 Tax=Actinomyces gaoshouyii TaxID=1960083 RepID=UPI0009C05AAD|nr:hypothetical protein [Actinomyces gaoshouyii]ARD42471.1 hypothetical protein B6G06_09085 [Actinomyces gaoshouyii]
MSISILDEITRRDAIVGEVASHFLYYKEFRTAEELSALHAAGGDEWGDLLDGAIRAARPLVDEDGTWTHTVIGYDGEQSAIETIDLPLIIEAAATARALRAMQQEGLHTPVRAMGEVSRQYRAALDRANAEVLREVLAAERGLID